jgi:hypothetical protein
MYLTTKAVMFITFAVLLGIIGLLYHAEKDLKSFMF